MIWRGPSYSLVIFCYRRVNNLTIFRDTQAGLFSAVVTTFIIEGYKSLRPDPQDATVALLARVSLQLAAMANGTQANLPSPSPEQITFIPSSSAVRGNVFWFLSLSFSLASALTATLVKLWVRTYLHTIDRVSAPGKRAKMRAYLFEGFEHFGMSTVVEAIPTLLHISCFLFLAGLWEFLRPINSGISYLILGILVLCASLYVTVSSVPALLGNWPYATPLSSFLRRIIRALFQVACSLWWLIIICAVICRRLYSLVRRTHTYDSGFGQISQMIRNPVVSEPSQILWGKCTSRLLSDVTTWPDGWDEKALRWTIRSLTEDSDLEPFVEGISEFVLPDEGNGMRTIVKLMYDTDVRLGPRIVRLLATCAGGSTLDSLSRQRRALACCAAMVSLAKGLPSLRSQYDMKRFVSILTELSRDSAGVFADHTRCTVVAVACIMLRNMEEYSNLYRRHYPWEPMDPFRDELLEVVANFSEVAEMENLRSLPFQSISKLPSSHCEVGKSIPPPHGWHKQLRNARFLALIDFMGVLTKTSSIPTETLHSFPRTIDLLAPREQDPQTQNLFVDAMCSAVGIVLQSDINGSVENRDDGLKLPESMISPLLALLKDLSDATAITKAKEVVGAYRRLHLAH